MDQQESTVCCICEFEAPDVEGLEQHIWENHESIFKTVPYTDDESESVNNETARHFTNGGMKRDASDATKSQNTDLLPSLEAWKEALAASGTTISKTSVPFEESGPSKAKRTKRDGVPKKTSRKKTASANDFFFKQASAQKGFFDTEMEGTDTLESSDLEVITCEPIIKSEPLDEEMLPDEDDLDETGPTRKRRKKKSSKTFHCEQCNVSLHNKAALIRHVREQHEGISRTFNCRVCDVSFTNEFRLKHHRRSDEHLDKFQDVTQKLLQSLVGRKFEETSEDSQQANNDQSASEDKSSNEDSNINAGDHRKGEKRRYVCKFCQLNFGNGFELHRHKAAAQCHQIKTEDLGESFVQVLIVESENTFPCELCDKVFEKKNYYTRHKKTVHGSKKIKLSCEICNTVVFEQNYYNHVQKHLEDVMKQKAEVQQQRRRRRGIKNTDPVLCEICNVAVRFKNLRRHHMEVHQGIRRTHPCTICRSIFQTDSMLQKHLKTHKEEDRTETYQ